jgi:hypothetical protein
LDFFSHPKQCDVLVEVFNLADQKSDDLESNHFVVICTSLALIAKNGGEFSPVLND